MKTKLFLLWINKVVKYLKYTVCCNSCQARQYTIQIKSDSLHSTAVNKFCQWQMWYHYIRFKSLSSHAVHKKNTKLISVVNVDLRKLRYCECDNNLTLRTECLILEMNEPWIIRIDSWYRGQGKQAMGVMKYTYFQHKSRFNNKCSTWVLLRYLSATRNQPPKFKA